MLPKLEISAHLLKRLEQVKQQSSGCLFGVLYNNNTLLLMGFNLETTLGQLNYEHIQYKFPAEMDLCGLVKFGDCSDAEAHLGQVFKDVDITDNPVLLQCQLGTVRGLKAAFLLHGKLQDVPYEVMEAERLYRDFCFTRLKCSWSIYTHSTEESVRERIHDLRKRISGGSLAFNIYETKIYVTNAGIQLYYFDGGKRLLDNNSTIQDLNDAIEEFVMQQRDDLEIYRKTNKKYTSSQSKRLSTIYGAVGVDYDIINVSALSCKTRDSNVSSTNNHQDDQLLPSLSMFILPQDVKYTLPIDLDAMAILSKNTKLCRLYDILIESICRSLRLTEYALCDQHTARNNNQEQQTPFTLKSSRMYNFAPSELGHFVSCCYLEGVSDDETYIKEQRKRLHRHFGLPATRPLFRRPNSCLFWDEQSKSDPLLNVHIGVRPSGLMEGKQYLVQGLYRYYHYFQQQISDNGWGCAYRSLQTICSWFQLQGYTEAMPPTHSEIQEYLVKIGDKPQDFKGSSQWIGSTEVSMCLKGLINVDSKILHVSSGKNVWTLATELMAHFQTHGTPIMIGGGVLAHTIIGVEQCNHTGQVKYLILDPHYTGDDDLVTIHTKGWCGWKDSNFWDKRSYYNLCLPQRPAFL